MSKLCAIFATTLLVSLAAQSRAEDTKPASTCNKCKPACHEGCGNFSLGALFDWATYRGRHRVIRHPYIPDPVPPLYTFFLHGWGEPAVIERPHTCTHCNHKR